MLTLALVASFLHARASDLAFGFVPNPGPKQSPALYVTPSRAVTELYVAVEVGGRTVEFTRRNVAGGVKQTFSWPRNPAVTHADAFVRAVFADGYVEETSVPVDWSFAGPLKVDLKGARADVAARSITVRANARVDTADLVAYGARKAELDRRTVTVDAGPGEITVPFVGDPAEVVLLDVTLRNATSWTGFTYSPWFLDIPHEDVLFASDSATVPADQAWKLDATLERLRELDEKYGSVVPIKLYVAGCTDTVGDAAHNRELSARRARAIATWLRGHGWSKPIYTWGFGEDLPAVPTGDNVDNVANRRALYLVGANPPPGGSGIPSVSWKLLP
jgi:outer membrane protein OmpA-like peptidoglycan-associated protein